MMQQSYEIHNCHYNEKQKQKTSKSDRFATAKLYYKDCTQLSLVIWFCQILAIKLNFSEDVTSMDLICRSIALLQTNTSVAAISFHFIYFCFLWFLFSYVNVVTFRMPTFLFLLHM